MNSKGKRRERQARAIYEDAGYAVQTFAGRKWRETDGFGLFDFMAIRRDRPVEFVQVKSNLARGIRSMEEDLKIIMPFDYARARYLVCYDREGWRLIDVRPEKSETLYDERDRDDAMGAGVEQYIREEI